MVWLAKSLGCDVVACSHLTVNSQELTEESLFFNQERCNIYLTKAQSLSEKYNLSLIAPPLFNANDEKVGPTPEPIEAWKKWRP